MAFKTCRWLAVLALGATLIALWVFSIPSVRAGRSEHVAADLAVVENARLMLDEGRSVMPRSAPSSSTSSRSDVECRWESV
jgi:hypothetical protein